MDEAMQVLEETDVRVEAVNHQFAVYPDLERDSGAATQKMLQAIDIASTLGARSVYLSDRRSWIVDLGGCGRTFRHPHRALRRARRGSGRDVLVENASPFTADIHMVHTLADTVALAELAGVGVCIEWHACWMEGGLKALLQRAIPMTGLVQVSDYVLGDRTVAVSRGSRRRGDSAGPRPR